MNHLVKLVKYHANKYPLMQPCDAVKLLYQHEFGGGHLIIDEASCLRFLEQEYAAKNEAAAASLLEDIGNERHRIYLSACSIEKLPLSCLNKIFAVSSSFAPGTMKVFLHKLAILRNVTKEGLFCFTANMLDSYLTEYKLSGCPALSHSAIYKNAYHPAYRVISDRFVRLFPLIYAINNLLTQKKRIVIAIDGNAASGKTTASNLLCTLYDAAVIHMDDFFLPPELRTPQRFQEAGGNLHYERFEAEVLSRLCTNTSFSHRVFDCHCDNYIGKKTIPLKPLTIIEGAYSLHPRFQKSYDLNVFSSIPAAEQKRRILERNGESCYQRFSERWIPLENTYFDSYSIRKNSDILL